MERVLVGLALALAGAMVVWSLVGEDGFQFTIDDDEDEAGVAVAAPAIAGGDGQAVQPTPYAATRLRIENAAAIVTLLPEDRSDIAVSVTGGSRLPALTARVAGDQLILDGGLDRRIRGCNRNAVNEIGANGERFSVRVSGLGELSRADLPSVTVRVPRMVDYEAEGAVVSDIGPAAQGRLSLGGCGGGTIGDIAGPLALRVAGSGDVRGGAAQSLELSISGSSDVALGAIATSAGAAVAGSGDARIGPIAQGLSVSIAGSGDLEAERVSGPLVVSIAGSGDVAIGGGEPGPVDVTIAGSGGVTVDGPVRDLSAKIMGSGRVEVARVEGRIERTVMGSGEVVIGQ